MSIPEYPKPPFPPQPQQPPGTIKEMDPPPDHGEITYSGSGKLKGKVALITGGDSGIGRAVAIAFAREGADILLSYLDEHDDAKSTADLIEKTGRKAVLVAGDITSQQQCEILVDRCVEELGRLDILVNNAAFQRSYHSIEDISAEDWDTTFRTNIYAPFYLVKAALPHLEAGSSIINTTSIQSKDPSGNLLAYAATKGAISNFTVGLAQMLGGKGIRVNAVAPGPIWTPLIPSTLPSEKVQHFGEDTALGRVDQPAELAGAYVLLASDAGSYITGAVIPVTGGEAML